jgi:hypothetical protein
MFGVESLLGAQLASSTTTTKRLMSIEHAGPSIDWAFAAVHPNWATSEIGRGAIPPSWFRRRPQH